LAEARSRLGRTRAAFFGFSAAMLGISGFESSANFVEAQAGGAFPEFVVVEGAFGPEQLRRLSEQWRIPTNLMFIGLPGERFPHGLADLGGCAAHHLSPEWRRVLARLGHGRPLVSRTVPGVPEHRTPLGRRVETPHSSELAFRNSPGSLGKTFALPSVREPSHRNRTEAKS
jgi:hypothetical protein